LGLFSWFGGEGGKCAEMHPIAPKTGDKRATAQTLVAFDSGNLKSLFAEILIQSVATGRQRQSVEESQQSRACGVLYFVVTFLRTNFWQTV